MTSKFWGHLSPLCLYKINPVLNNSGFLLLTSLAFDIIEELIIKEYIWDKDD